MAQVQTLRDALAARRARKIRTMLTRLIQFRSQPSRPAPVKGS